SAGPSKRRGSSGRSARHRVVQTQRDREIVDWVVVETDVIDARERLVARVTQSQIVLRPAWLSCPGLS
ncbi:MAG TPA: hypothetical protein VGI27_08165, partial [Solirubrobacteraceae bacterium]